MSLFKSKEFIETKKIKTNLTEKLPDNTETSRSKFFEKPQEKISFTKIGALEKKHDNNNVNIRDIPNENKPKIQNNINSNQNTTINVDKEQLDTNKKILDIINDEQQQIIANNITSKETIQFNEKTSPVAPTKIITEPKPAPSQSVIMPTTPIIKQNPTKSNEEKKDLSIILKFAATRPIETTYDLSCRFPTEPTVKLDIKATDQDFENLVNLNPDMKYLDISNCQVLTDYSILNKLTNLEQLDVSGLYNLKDISFLKNMPKLKVLNIGLTGIDNIDDLPPLPNLEVLNLKFLKIKNINSIKNCPNIHDLTLWGCEFLTDISAVSICTQLRALNLEYCPSIKHINAIANLDKLMYLNLNFDKIEDLSPIKNLVNLLIFTMDYCQLIMTEKNLTYFENLTKMVFLDLRNRMIRNLHYFRNMTNMARLELASNSISDLSPLENMTKMKKLNLSVNTNLVDISPLYKMESLTDLILNGAKVKSNSINMCMKIEDFSVIKHFPKLEVIESTYNEKVKDVSALQYCGELLEAYFSNCLQLKDITALRFCKKLYQLEIENCSQIKDISFLKYCNNLRFLFIGKSSIDRLQISDLMSIDSMILYIDGSGTAPVHKVFTRDNWKMKTKIIKVARKNIKPEDVV